MYPSDDTREDDTLIPERLELRCMTFAKKERTASRALGEARTMELYISKREVYISSCVEVDLTCSEFSVCLRFDLFALISSVFLSVGLEKYAFHI